MKHLSDLKITYDVLSREVADDGTIIEITYHRNHDRITHGGTYNVAAYNADHSAKGAMVSFDNATDAIDAFNLMLRVCVALVRKPIVGVRKALGGRR